MVGGELMVGREVRRDTDHFTAPPPLLSHPSNYPQPPNKKRRREGALVERGEGREGEGEHFTIIPTFKRIVFPV